MTYVVKVHLLPQDTQGWEYVVATLAARDKLESVVYSADDAKRLVAEGQPGSKVIVWSPYRWTGGDIVQWLGVPCETRWFETRPTKPIQVYPRYDGYQQWNGWAVEAIERTGADWVRMNTSQPDADEGVGWPI